MYTSRRNKVVKQCCTHSHHIVEKTREMEVWSLNTVMSKTLFTEKCWAPIERIKVIKNLIRQFFQDLTAFKDSKEQKSITKFCHLKTNWAKSCFKERVEERGAPENRAENGCKKGQASYSALAAKRHLGGFYHAKSARRGREEKFTRFFKGARSPFADNPTPDALPWIKVVPVLSFTFSAPHGPTLIRDPPRAPPVPTPSPPGPSRLPPRNYTRANPNLTLQTSLALFWCII